MLLDEHLDDVAEFDVAVALLVLELAQVHATLRLEANVHDGVVADDVDDGAIDDAAVLDFLGCSVEKLASSIRRSPYLLTGWGWFGSWVFERVPLQMSPPSAAEKPRAMS